MKPSPPVMRTRRRRRRRQRRPGSESRPACLEAANGLCHAEADSRTVLDVNDLGHVTEGPSGLPGGRRRPVVQTEHRGGEYRAPLLERLALARCAASVPSPTTSSASASVTPSRNEHPLGRREPWPAADPPERGVAEERRRAPQRPGGGAIVPRPASLPRTYYREAAAAA